MFDLDELDNSTDNEALSSVENSTPEELRQPTSVHDLKAITQAFRTMESLESEYARSQLVRGRVAKIAHVKVPGQPAQVYRPLGMGGVKAVQVANRGLWR